MVSKPVHVSGLVKKKKKKRMAKIESEHLVRPCSTITVNKH